VPQLEEHYASIGATLPEGLRHELRELEQRLAQ
jgi:hypothetical protein